MASTAKQESYTLEYRVLRNISAPEDDADDRKVYTGQAPASSLLDLEDDENVREYLVEAKGKQKHSPTLVHQAIRKTLRDHPDQFNILNGGLVIVARSATVDDAKKIVRLEKPSIINGSQTQGELKRFFNDHVKDETGVDPSVKFELIITKDRDLIAEISIARNFQNDVRAISIAGRRGQLDELESALQAVYPKAKLRKSETDLTNDGEYIDTEKLIQVLFAILPEEVLDKLDRLDSANKVFTYSQKTRCLKLFQNVVDNGPVEVYEAFMDLAPTAWGLYEKWKSHQGFKGTRIRSITREDGVIVEVPDGVIFPILAAHSAFVVKPKKSAWVMRKPDALTDAELIDVAKQAYMEIAGSNPQTMGKSKACYSTLHQITSIFARLAKGGSNRG
ncbi:AIPR family protein [Sphingobium sp. SA2]|uniref:AIPR family protein n=1 Tax=Sphingobium sp. SA2 TaxID=1524832 RepID=UPI0028C22286|nr:AIPR family protein [Sphingobium sp. SA2]MDT7535833.1 AIPR family protein [Sphingobium sp. SA2]